MTCRPVYARTGTESVSFLQRSRQTGVSETHECRNATRRWKSAFTAVTMAQRLARHASERAAAAAEDGQAAGAAKGHTRQASTDVSDGGYDTAEEETADHAVGPHEPPEAPEIRALSGNVAAVEI
jgi:hypothetical protein